MNQQGQTQTRLVFNYTGFKTDKAIFILKLNLNMVKQFEYGAKLLGNQLSWEEFLGKSWFKFGPTPKAEICREFLSNLVMHFHKAGGLIRDRLKKEWSKYKQQNSNILEFSP